ncbi:MAG: tRNA threonylcarbamoyladenosine dehydratase [Negativicutes bacterium]|nr:tRNA threonylcarbamoyladenosine dehydratase [Negativicutes bacterium]
MDSLIRLKMIYGEESVANLKKKKVILFGVGGVGSFTAEALARSGIGAITLVDFDRVSVTNINRQMPARIDTVGRLKVEVVREDIRAINPECDVQIVSQAFKSPELTPGILTTDFDYVIDAIDDVPAKTELLIWAYENKIPVVSSMGAGNKVDPTAFRIADISKTHTCALARAIRKSLGDRGIKKGIRTVFSTEVPRKPQASAEKGGMKENPPGSVCHVTGTAGLIVASVVINELTQKEEEK